MMSTFLVMVAIRLVIDLLSLGIDPLCVLNCVNWISLFSFNHYRYRFFVLFAKKPNTHELIEKLYLE